MKIVIEYKSEISKRLSSFGERRIAGSQLLMFPSLLGDMNLRSIFQFVFRSLDVTNVYHHSFPLPFPIQSYLIREFGRRIQTQIHIWSHSFHFLSFWEHLPMEVHMCIYVYIHTHTLVCSSILPSGKVCELQLLRPGGSVYLILWYSIRNILLLHI